MRVQKQNRAQKTGPMNVGRSWTPTANSTSIRPKLMVSTPGDIYEQEADRVAGQVVGMPETHLQTKRIRMSSDGEAGAPTIASRAISSAGESLGVSARGFMESRFSHDFSRVRIHNNAQSDVAARQLSARAFTVGSDIAFRQGEYQPGTTAGRWLMAHELTHVIQQGAAAGFGRKLGGVAGVQRSPGTDPEPPVATNGTIDTEFFEKKYAEDKANQSLQTKSEYLGFVHSFYEGNLFADGWDEQSASLIEKVTSPANKATVKTTLVNLGKTIAAEWAKDNSVRKIKTDNLKEWGSQLKTAKNADDGSGTKILSALGSIKAAVATKLGK
jgi:hypothetical protein